MVVKQTNWNTELAEALRLIGIHRVRLTYRQTKTRNAFTRDVAVIGSFKAEIIGFLGHIGMLQKFLGTFEKYSRAKEGQIVAKYLVVQHLDPRKNDCCYEIDDDIFNELSMKIGYNEMPQLRSETTSDGPTLVPVETSMINHTDWPYGAG